MYRYKVAEMTCGHCSSVIEKAVKSVDPQADISVDLDKTEVAVRSEAEEDRIASAIRSAGYENERLAA